MGRWFGRKPLRPESRNSSCRYIYNIYNLNRFGRLLLFWAWLKAGGHGWDHWKQDPFTACKKTLSRGQDTGDKINGEVSPTTRWMWQYFTILKSRVSWITLLFPIKQLKASSGLRALEPQIIIDFEMESRRDRGLKKFRSELTDHFCNDRQPCFAIQQSNRLRRIANLRV